MIRATSNYLNRGEAELRTPCDTNMNVIKIKRKKFKKSFLSMKIGRSPKYPERNCQVQLKLYKELCERYKEAKFSKGPFCGTKQTDNNLN